MKKRILSLLTCMVMVFSLAACGGGDTTTSTPPAEESKAPASTPSEVVSTGTVQGVTDTEILVGNTAAVTGAFAVVGVPFNAGLEATFKWYNDNGGFNGKKIKFVTYDDGFDAAQGMTYTKTLVEDDKVFALVGHFGTNTVAATMDYVKQTGIPTAYIVTGISELYAEGATGKDACYFPVQPIYDAEGRVLLARALASTEGNYGLGGTKIGVIATTDDAGNGILTGIKRQEQEVDVEIVYQEVDAAATDYTAAVSVLKNQGCDVVIASMNQAPVQTVMAAMRDINYNAKVITSYVSANNVFLGGLVANGSVTADRPIYTTSWLDTTTEVGMAEYLAFAEIMAAWEAENGVAADQTMVLNSYAMCGYIAGMNFIHGLDQLEASGEELTWENYIAAMEKAPYHIPMGGDIDYAGGDRIGVTALALNTISLEPNAETGLYELLAVSPLISLDEVCSKIP